MSLYFFFLGFDQKTFVIYQSVRFSVEVFNYLFDIAILNISGEQLTIPIPI